MNKENFFSDKNRPDRKGLSDFFTYVIYSNASDTVGIYDQRLICILLWSGLF